MASAVPVAALAVALGGCSGPAPAAPEPPAPSSEPSFAPVSAISQLRERRDEHRRQIHDATQLAIAECMHSRGFAYTPRRYPGALGEDPDWAGLSPRQIDRWTVAFQGKRIPPAMLAHPSRIRDATILVAKGPVSTIYLRRDACTTVGRAAVYGDLVGWVVVEQVIDHLAERALDRAEGDERRQVELEAELAAEHRVAIDRFSQLHDRAIARADRLLRQSR